MKFRTVIDVKGVERNVRETYIVGNKFYYSEEFVFIDGRGYSIDDKRISKCMVTGQMNLTLRMIPVHSDENVVVGYCNQDYRTRFTTCVDGNSKISKLFVSEEAAIAAGYQEDVYASIFCKNMPITKSPLPYKRFSFPPTVNRLMDNIMRPPKELEQEYIKYGMKSPTFTITEGKRYKFGVEIETSIGCVPESKIQHLPVKCVFDGSLRGPGGEDPTGGEYVTAILEGDTGFKVLQEITRTISERCHVDKRCSVHVHLSSDGFDVSKDTVVWSYILNKILEPELYSIMPKSRSTNSYCRPLNGPEINLKEAAEDYNHFVTKFYNELQKIVGVNKDAILSKKKNHPLGHHCGYNKDTPRYWWLNFVPTMFNTRGNESYSLEFRMHGGTMNYGKIKNWILICMGLFYFAENYSNKINKNITLEEVMKVAYPKKWKRLVDYIEERKRIFSDEKKENLEYGKEGNLNARITKISEL